MYINIVLYKNRLKSDNSRCVEKIILSSINNCYEKYFEKTIDELKVKAYNQFLSARQTSSLKTKQNRNANVIF